MTPKPLNRATMRPRERNKMNRQFTLLIDHDRRGRGHGGPQIMPLEFLMRGLHAHPLSRRLDREIDGHALNYDSKRIDTKGHKTKCSTN